MSKYIAFTFSPLTNVPTTFLIKKYPIDYGRGLCAIYKFPKYFRVKTYYKAIKRSKLCGNK